MSKYDDLVSKLKEIFQIDKPELDFGVYRILNARSAEISDYLENRLKAKVLDSLSSAGNAESEQVKKDLAEAEKNAANLGVAPENVPKVQELRQKLASYSAGNNEHENAVFTHLLTFFSRYYDSGDFISQRRYKGDTYAIPYAGEEVMLHWANKDQYYTKSGENFSNYAFKLDDGRVVRFKLVTADTAKDNRKDNDKERRFALIEAQTRTLIDDEGDEYEETLLPITEETNLEGTQELVIRFEYKAYPKGTKQETLSELAIKTILETLAPLGRGQGEGKGWHEALSQREPTEKNPTRTLLEKCLTNYTSKNTADYFIHKDLGGFLKRELDFYIKNEVMHLDDVQHAQAFADVEKNLRMIQTLRSIAQDIITFLAQLEDFQKKLWLKKKFVVSTHYCITLDRIDEALYPQIAANQKQWEQWQQLGMLEGKIPSGGAAIAHLKTYPFLMVDTALFDAEFKFSLLKQVDAIDEKLDGLLIHGDNFLALNLLENCYRGQVSCIYIDPPYNAKTSEILYKNAFKHSSWLSLISNRLEASKKLVASDGGVVIAIDENEQEYLGNVLTESFPMFRKHCASLIHNKKGIQGSDFSYCHEYAYFLLNYDHKGTFDKPIPESEWEWANLRKWGSESTRDTAKNCFYPIVVKDEKIIGFGEVCSDDFHPEKSNIKQDDGSIFVYPVDPNGIERKWRYGQKTVGTILDVLKVVKQTNGDLQIHKAKNFQQFKTIWDDNRYIAGDFGTKVITEMGINPRDNLFPKSVYTVKDSIFAVAGKGGLVLDYFAGSGTTGHAAISLNRDDNGQRKYILVEQGEYFNTVTKPRIQKVVYSADWKDGKATAPKTGISHAFKVLKIESYEDTLNNLQLNRSQAQQDLLSQLPETAQDDYLMRYMLDVESKDSLLSVKHFNKPFDYKLKVAVDSAGAYEEKQVDLVETFNYLIGLHVAQIDYQLAQGFATITGRLPSGDKTLVLWRDTEQVDYEALNKLCDKLAINPADSEYDVVFINGDHNIPTSFTALENEGGITKTLKIRSIEEAFLTAMFDVEDV